MREIDKIVIHCSATYSSMDIDADWIKNIHVNENGWSDIGYHYVILRNSDIEQGRSLDVAGAHVKGFNRKSIGICLVGGLGGNDTTFFNFRSGQLETLRLLVNELLGKFPEAEVLGHNDLDPKKGCPGFDVKEWFSNRI